MQHLYSTMFCVFLCIAVCYVLSTSAIDCLEIFVSEMACCVSGGTSTSHRACITAGVSDVCLECAVAVAVHSIQHLFHCPVHLTLLTVQHLWTQWLISSPGQLITSQKKRRAVGLRWATTTAATETLLTCFLHCSKVTEWIMFLTLCFWVTQFVSRVIQNIVWIFLWTFVLRFMFAMICKESC